MFWISAIMIFVQYCILIIQINRGTLWSLQLSKYFVAALALESIIHFSGMVSLQKGAFWNHSLAFTMRSPGCCYLLQSVQRGEFMCVKIIIMWEFKLSFLLVSIVLQHLCKHTFIPVRHLAPLLYSSITIIQFGTRTQTKPTRSTWLFRQE